MQQKIQKLLNVPRYQDYTKAGELAVRLAVLLVGEDVMKHSGLGDNKGKLRALDETKLQEIEDIVKQMYRGRGDVEGIWTKCRIAVAKKCQRTYNHNHLTNMQSQSTKH